MGTEFSDELVDLNVECLEVRLVTDRETGSFEEDEEDLVEVLWQIQLSLVFEQVEKKSDLLDKKDGLNITEGYDLLASLDKQDCARMVV